MVLGNLLTLPVGGGLLYVQPVYVQSSTGTQYPLLQRVLVAFGNEIGFANTLGGALDQVFGGDAGVGTTPPVDVGPTTGSDDEPDDRVRRRVRRPVRRPARRRVDDGHTGPTTSPSDARARLDAALSRAKQALDDGQAALAKGDFAAYGEAQAQLQQALTDAIAAEAQIEG